MVTVAHRAAASGGARARGRGALPLRERGPRGRVRRGCRAWSRPAAQGGQGAQATSAAPAPAGGGLPARPEGRLGLPAAGSRLPPATGRSGKPSPGSATEVPVLRRLFARSRLLGRPETRGLWPWVSVRLLPGRARFRQWPRWCRPERGPEPVWPGFALFLTCPRLRRCRLAPAHDSVTGVRSKVCSKDPPPKLEIAASAAATRAPSRKGGRAAPAEHTQP